jgi:hypothetical protein
MANLKLRRPEDIGPSDRAGTWGELVAWFSELVLCLDRGDLPGAVEAQSRIERHGFKVSYRRIRRVAEGGGR